MQVEQELYTQGFAQTQKLYQGTGNKYSQEDSGFKAWESQSILTDNNTNLLHNLKSQLLNYEQKYKKRNVHTLPIKLPSLQNIKRRKCMKKYKSSTIDIDQKPPSEGQIRKQETKQQGVQNKQNIYKHRSVEIVKKSSIKMNYSKRTNPNYTCNKLKPNQQSYSIEVIEQKVGQIAKVQQMRFTQNQTRIRKRDIYLSIFGQRGKGKVQKIAFDDENKPYQIYLQRRKQQTKPYCSKQQGQSISNNRDQPCINNRQGEKYHIQEQKEKWLPCKSSKRLNGEIQNKNVKPSKQNALNKSIKGLSYTICRY